MKALIDRFASLRVTVSLLVLVLVALAAGTIVESLHGAEAAGRAVYGAGWFRALLAVYALHLCCSLVSLWPWGRRRIGYAITHGSMLVILGRRAHDRPREDRGPAPRSGRARSRAP